jgi:hypothetical protein
MDLIGEFERWSTAATALMSTADPVIPVFGWEGDVAKALDIGIGQMRLVLCLYLALPINFGAHRS